MAKKSDPKNGVNIDDMERFNKYLNKIINDIMLKNMDIKSALANTPFQNGISIKFDASGMPVIDGMNSNIAIQGQVDRRSDDTLVDVIEKGDSIIIDAALPGVNAGDIKIETTQTSMHIMAASNDRHYDKRIDLPSSVSPESGKAVYNNGILEVTLNKAQSPKGAHIEVK